MTSVRWIGIALALSAATVLTGCQTAKDSASIESRIRINKGAYEGEASPLGGDIKSILMAGGLDITNPSSPTGSTSKAEIGRSMASSTETLVAALSDGQTRTASAAQTMKPETSATIMAQSLAASSKQDSAPPKALALVEDKSSKRRQRPSAPPEKKTVYEVRIEHDKDPLVELASINATGSRIMNDYAFDPLPPASVVQVNKAEVSKPEPKKVDKANITESKPLPTASIDKTPRETKVATVVPAQKSEVLEKKSRVRRF